MKLIRSFALAVAALAVASGTANAWGNKSCPTCNHSGSHVGSHGWPAPSTLFGNHHAKPTFQAAPWYNYWPYDGHFLTPAPVGGAFNAPPLTGNFPVNPYFPGGPPPGGFPVMPPPGGGR